MVIGHAFMVHGSGSAVYVYGSYLRLRNSRRHWSRSNAVSCLMLDAPADSDGKRARFSSNKCAIGSWLLLQASGGRGDVGHVGNEIYVRVFGDPKERVLNDPHTFKHLTSRHKSPST
jgi:hypothetical protein